MTVQDGLGPEDRGIGPDTAIFAAPFASPGAAIATPSADVVAFVGRCLKGPVDQPVTVDDFATFQQLFGGLWSGSLLPHALEQFFEQGGRRAVIVRVVNAARAPTIDLPAGPGRLTLVGLSPGSHEFLRASVDHDGIARQDQDLFNLVVQRVRARGSELVEEQEIYRRVSILSGSARDVARKLTGSRLVRVAGPLPPLRPDITRGPDYRALIGFVDCNHDGEDGLPLSDYDLIGSEARRTGLFALREGPAFSFLYLPPPARDRDVGMSALLVAARLCRRQHALLLVDPPSQWRGVPQALEAMRVWPLHSADALMFFPRVLARDRLTGEVGEFPPSPAAIGALLRDATPRDWQQSLEDALLRPVATPAVWVDRLQRQQLAQRGVNALRGTRTPAREAVPLVTLAGETGNGPEARLVSARRLALLLAASIERGTRWVVVEGNTPRSRERVVRQVSQFLGEVAATGALAGGERNRHYFVLCDERLNGPLQQAGGVFRLVYGYRSVHAPTRQAFLVEHRLDGSHTRAVSLNRLATLDLQVG